MRIVCRDYLQSAAPKNVTIAYSAITMVPCSVTAALAHGTYGNIYGVTSLNLVMALPDRYLLTVPIFSVAHYGKFKLKRKKKPEKSGL